VKKELLMNRRSVLKGSALMLGALAAPAIISKKALASSGELNFTGWAGYPGMTEKVVPAFEAATGIKVNFKEMPSQDDMFSEAKAMISTGGMDIYEPTVDRVAAWNSNGLVQGWDTAKLALDNYLPGMADGSIGERSTIDGQRMIVLSVWGTEALVVDKDNATLGEPASLGALFDPANQVVLRPHSALAAMGRWLDATGKLPRPWMDSYTDMAAMTELWDIALAEAIKAKANVVQWWSGENEAQAGFLANGATVGLCWDSTGLNMGKQGNYGYVAPAEGAFAWNQGLILMKNAANVEQAHEFAKWVSTAEGSSLWATAFGANPVGKGGPELMDAEVSAFYNSTFNDAALANLWWWPDQSAEFLAKRAEYADKYKAA
jgi:spermidine/putrescine transport system substrate-binding protein